MRTTIRATVKVAGFQKERNFRKGTPARIIKAWKVSERAKLQKRHPQPERNGQAGTLARDAERYYPLVKHLADWVSRRSEIRAWLPHLGETPRHMITREDILRIRGRWVSEGRKPKTINNRVTALRNLFHLLDGDDSPTPCDGVKQLTPEKVPPQIVTGVIINRVLDNLQRRADAGHKHAAADRARLMVLASTGKRPCEIERAQPGDVDLRRRVWIARDAKGGFCPGAYLNNEMVLAWEAFILADAWGPFPGHFPRRLRDAGWPEGLRPYNLRHSTWIEASERGNDLSDIQAGAGHKLIATTRRHYVPVLSSRMQRMSESLDGRFGWE
jgi:integrase